MARFVTTDKHSFYIGLDSEIEEELTTEQAAAWGTVRIAFELSRIGTSLAEIAQGLRQKG